MKILFHLFESSILIVSFIILLNNDLKNIFIKNSFKILFAAAILSLASLLLITSWYALSYVYLDHVESSVAIISFLFKKGELIYPALNGPETFNSPYGPLVFILNGFFIKLFGANIFVSKLGGVISADLSVVLLFFVLRKKLGNYYSLLCCGYVVLIYYSFLDYWAWNGIYWNRPDPFILFFVTLGLWGVTQNNKLLAIMLSGLALGAVADLKISEVVYFLPVYALLYRRHGAPNLALALIISMITAFFPFIIFKNVLLDNYLATLKMMAKEGIVFKLFKINLSSFFGRILLPFFVFILSLFTLNMGIFKNIFREHKFYIRALILCSVMMVIIAAKRGSSGNSLLPLAVLYIYLFTFFNGYKIDTNLLIKNKLPGLVFAGSICAIITFIVCPVVRKGILYAELFYNKSKLESGIVSDVKGLIIKYPNTSMAMGYGGDYNLTLCRPLLVFANNRYFLDAAFLMDREITGVQLPLAAVRDLSACKTKIFLIPHGGKPFDLRNIYDDKPLFSQEFKNVFLGNYALTQQSRYFDVWSCKE